MPDLFISKAHVYDGDSIYVDCKILPANLLRQPPNLKNNNVYFYNLFTALRHAGDLDKLRNKGVKTAALSISVGLYGRWYHVNSDSRNEVRDYAPGDACFQQLIKFQLRGITEVCHLPKYNIQESKLFACKYIVDRTGLMTFAYDTTESLKYKLCFSRKNATTLKYGLTAVGLEYSDAAGHCGMGRFPMLTTVKRTLKFFKEKYKSPNAYQDCLHV
ncbi:uncharacterized protein LOC142592659 [Dermacentor variabilis]|uniref:uncharacterized protein LOC142592659 n=1 Tax=Dermacentor variabilis TaxID=34621 RepID=UPI003F5B0B10